MDSAQTTARHCSMYVSIQANLVARFGAVHAQVR
jgi:hypothetical protein